MLTARPNGGGKTILVVEDQQESLFLVRKTLQQQGYEVLFARNGQDALKVCRAHIGPIHLVIADVVMPGMSGPQLTDALRSIRPQTPVLFMSGIMSPAAVSGGAGFLPKPFGQEQLLEKVTQLLGSTAA